MEGHSTNRASPFNRVYYNYWEVRIKIYLQSIDCVLWRFAENGPFVPTKKDEDKLVPKDKLVHKHPDEYVEKKRHYPWI